MLGGVTGCLGWLEGNFCVIGKFIVEVERDFELTYFGMSGLRLVGRLALT